MDFGRPDGPDLETSIALPPLDLRASLGPPARVRLGTPSWSHREWVGAVYPRGTPAGRWLGCYARWLPAVELDATYHRLPSAELLARWREQAPPDFRFCPKLPRAVSQAKDLGASGGLARAAERLRVLGDRLGPALLQLPERFGPEGLDTLERLLEAPPLELAVELRHPGLGAAARARVAARGARVVTTDVSGRRDVLHGTISGRGAFVRLGAFLDPARDATRLRAWEERLAGLPGGEHFLFVHQPDPRVALALLSEAGGPPTPGLDRAP